MGRVAVGPDKAPVFHHMFISAQQKKKDDGILDGIVNQWMICEAKRLDEAKGKQGYGPTERSLRGSMISPRLYMY